MKIFITKTGVPCIILNHGKRMIHTPTIKYIEGDGNYCNINVTNGKPLTSSFTLRLFSDQLKANSDFFSPRKGLLINLKFLKEVLTKSGALFARLETGETLPLSRRKGRALIEYINANGLNIEMSETVK